MPQKKKKEPKKKERKEPEKAPAKARAKKGPGRPKKEIPQDQPQSSASGGSIVGGGQPNASQGAAPAHNPQPAQSAVPVPVVAPPTQFQQMLPQMSQPQYSQPPPQMQYPPQMHPSLVQHYQPTQIPTPSSSNGVFSAPSNSGPISISGSNINNTTNSNDNAGSISRCRNSTGPAQPVLAPVPVDRISRRSATPEWKNRIVRPRAHPGYPRSHPYPRPRRSWSQFSQRRARSRTPSDQSSSTDVFSSPAKRRQIMSRSRTRNSARLSRQSSVLSPPLQSNQQIKRSGQSRNQSRSRDAGHRQFQSSATTTPDPIQDSSSDDWMSTGSGDTSASLQRQRLRDDKRKRKIEAAESQKKPILSPSFQQLSTTNQNQSNPHSSSVTSQLSPPKPHPIQGSSQTSGNSSDAMQTDSESDPPMSTDSETQDQSNSVRSQAVPLSHESQRLTKKRKASAAPQLTPFDILDESCRRATIVLMKRNRSDLIPKLEETRQKIRERKPPVVQPMLTNIALEMRLSMNNLPLTSRSNEEFAAELAKTNPDAALIENDGNNDCVIRTVLFMVSLPATKDYIFVMRQLLAATLEQAGTYTFAELEAVRTPRTPLRLDVVLLVPYFTKSPVVIVRDDFGKFVRSTHDTDRPLNDLSAFLRTLSQNDTPEQADVIGIKIGAQVSHVFNLAVIDEKFVFDGLNLEGANFLRQTSFEHSAHISKIPIFQTLTEAEAWVRTGIENMMKAEPSKSIETLFDELRENLINELATDAANHRLEFEKSRTSLEINLFVKSSSSAMNQFADGYMNSNKAQREASFRKCIDFLNQAVHKIHAELTSHNSGSDSANIIVPLADNSSKEILRPKQKARRKRSHTRRIDPKSSQSNRFSDKKLIQQIHKPSEVPTSGDGSAIVAHSQQSSESSTSSRPKRMKRAEEAGAANSGDTTVATKSGS